jgi:peptidyl-prolyl cis-trans isomerase B (cyclophilin B)
VAQPRDKREAARAKLEARMAEKAAAAKRKRRVQVTLATILAVAVLGGIGFFFFKVISNAVSSDSADKKTDGRVVADDGHPKDKVLVKDMSMSKPAATSAGSVSCTYKKSSKDEVKANKHLKNVGTPGNGKKPDTGVQHWTIKLSQGTIKIDIDDSKAPCNAASFNYLVGKNFFDKSKCHRLTTANIYVLQCGDPSGTGQGGPTYVTKDENFPKDTAKDQSKKDKKAGKSPKANYLAGTIAMANPSQPDSNGSQFFIVYKDTYLKPDYTILGKVTSGLDVVKKIAKKKAWLSKEEQLQQQQQQMGGMG